MITYLVLFIVFKKDPRNRWHSRYSFDFVPFVYILFLRAIGNPYHDYEEDDIYDRAPEEAEKKMKLSIRNKTFSGEYYKPISQQHVRKYINRWKK